MSVGMFPLGVVSLGTNGTIVSAQYIAPTSDVSAGGWTASTGTDLFAMLNEAVPSDAEYIVSTTDTISEVKFATATNPGTTSGHVIRYRIRADGGGITVRLKQGATVIHTWTHSTVPSTYIQYDQTLSTGEAGSITDYSDLRLSFEAT